MNSIALASTVDTLCLTDDEDVVVDHHAAAALTTTPRPGCPLAVLAETRAPGVTG